MTTKFKDWLDSDWNIIIALFSKPYFMQSPLQIHFPPALCGDIKISNSYPAGYKYKIPFTTVSLTACDFGDFLVQAVNGDDYWMELWSFSVRHDGYKVASPLPRLNLLLC